MEKVKVTIAALLIAYIFVSFFIVIYSLLIWQLFPTTFSYTILVALVLLKGSIISLQVSQPVNELNGQDKITLRLILLISLIIFLTVLFMSYMFKGQHLASMISLITVFFIASRIKLSEPVH